jgi:Di-haem oxidoreductase, putative peroxidase
LLSGNPTPVFGRGLIENISDATILANMNQNSELKQSLGISGHPNVSPNDGSIMRFGWKAQNKSLETFAGEAYNVEIGVTNEMFTTERGNAPISGMFNPTPQRLDKFHPIGRPDSERPGRVRRLHALSCAASAINRRHSRKSLVPVHPEWKGAFQPDPL